MKNIKPIQLVVFILALGALGVILRRHYHNNDMINSGNISEQTNTQIKNRKLPDKFDPQFFIDQWHIKNNKASGGSTVLPDEQEREKQRQKLLLSAANQAFSICKNYIDAEDYIKRRNKVSKTNCVFFPEVAAMVGPEQLPQLYSMLNDPEYAPYYHNIVRMIGFASHDEQSSDVLWNFFQRPAEYWTKDSSPNNKYAKIFCLTLIGINGSEKYDPLLRKAATADGARELAANWINSPLIIDNKMGFYNQNDVINRIQIAALEGLLYTQRPENIAIVQQMYLKEYDSCTESNTKSRLMTMLTDIMGNKDYIADNCLEYLLILQSAPNLDVREAYVQKYRWTPKKP